MPKIHTVAQGECLSGIAAAYYFHSWKTIYNHPENAEFKKLRPNPNVIFPGDKIFIPTRDSKIEENKNTEQKHAFVLKRETYLLRLVLKDRQNKCFSEAKYKLIVGGKFFEGTTDPDGLLEHEIPTDATVAFLSAWLKILPEEPAKEYNWNLQLGHLDPITEISGVQARLNNLSYRCGSVDGVSGPRTKRAVKRFQEKNGLEPDGIIGNKTKNALLRIHGC